MAEKLTIGFLGAGKMATALAKGFIQAGLVKPAQIMASAPSEGTRIAFKGSIGAKVTASNVEVTKYASVLVLAVKPYQVADVLMEIRESFKNQLLVSIAAGIPIARLAAGLNAEARIVRVVPNTPALVGTAASSFSPGPTATAEDGRLVEKLLSSVGIALQVKEYLLDATTGLAGSGPAFIYMIIEALSDGGVASGLPRDIATKLAAQMVYGSAKMVLETGMHPGALKDMVTSPGGTTIEGVHELEKGGVRAALISAVRAATEKSKKLGQA